MGEEIAVRAKKERLRDIKRETSQKAEYLKEIQKMILIQRAKRVKSERNRKASEKRYNINILEMNKTNFNEFDFRSIGVEYAQSLNSIKQRIDALQQEFEQKSEENRQLQDENNKIVRENFDKSQKIRSINDKISNFSIMKEESFQQISDLRTNHIKSLRSKPAISVAQPPNTVRSDPKIREESQQIRKKENELVRIHYRNSEALQWLNRLSSLSNRVNIGVDKCEGMPIGSLLEKLETLRDDQEKKIEEQRRIYSGLLRSNAKFEDQIRARILRLSQLKASLPQSVREVKHSIEEELENSFDEENKILRKIDHLEDVMKAKQK